MTNSIERLHPAVEAAGLNEISMQEVLDRLEAAEKERDDVAQQLVQSERGKRAISEECDALRTEIAYVKEVEFPRKAQAVADAWKGKCKRLEVERDALRAKIEQMEKQEPVAYLPLSSARMLESGVVASGVVWNCRDKAASDIPLYARPGAQPAPIIPEGWKLVPIKPTPSMKTAGIGVEVYQDSPPAADCLTWEEVEAIYTAMIEVSPEVKS